MSLFELGYFLQQQQQQQQVSDHYVSERIARITCMLEGRVILSLLCMTCSLTENAAHDDNAVVQSRVNLLYSIIDDIRRTVLLTIRQIPWFEAGSPIYICKFLYHRYIPEINPLDFPRTSYRVHWVCGDDPCCAGYPAI